MVIDPQDEREIHALCDQYLQVMAEDALECQKLAEDVARMEQEWQEMKKQMTQ